MMKKIPFIAVLLFIAASILSKTCTQESVHYLFCHGLGCNAAQAQHYEKVRTSTDWIIQQPFVTFNFPDMSSGGIFDRSKTSLGQENEILALANAYEQALLHSNRIVAVGMSRGASTIVNFLATRAPIAIAAAVIESPFDSILTIIHSRLAAQQISWLPRFITETSPNVLFGQFDRNGIFPIDVAHNIRTDMPILIICSLEDSVIPALNSANIYLKLRETGHEHAYLLLLTKGAHAYLLWHADGDVYLNTVHAFYKKYNLPHNPALAVFGDTLLTQCQPSKEMIEKAIVMNKSYIY